MYIYVVVENNLPLLAKIRANILILLSNHIIEAKIKTIKGVRQISEQIKWTDALKSYIQFS